MTQRLDFVLTLISPLVLGRISKMSKSKLLNKEHGKIKLENW